MSGLVLIDDIPVSEEAVREELAESYLLDEGEEEEEEEELITAATKKGRELLNCTTIVMNHNG